MFYCEICRVLNKWPKGLGHSRGSCEICGEVNLCYDIPSKALPIPDKVKTIALIHAHEKESVTFTLDKLQGKKYFRVLRIIQKSQRHVILEYDEGELASPTADPLIIGTITTQITDDHGAVVPDYQIRVLWNEKLWRTVDEGTEELYSMLTGIKPDDMRRFAESLRGGGLGNSLRFQPADSGGPEKASTGK